MSKTSRANALAARLLRQGHPEQAFRILLVSFADDPGDARTLVLIAEAGSAIDASPQKSFDQLALEAALSAIALGPEDPEAWHRLSRVYLRIHAQPQARTAARRARDLDPNDWRSNVNVVEIDSMTKAVSRSTRASLAAAIRLAPNVPDVYFAAAQMETARDRPRAALAQYRRVLEFDPANSAALNNAAVIRLGQGKLGESAGTFVTLLASDPTSGIAFANLRVVARVALLLLNLGLLGLISIAFIPLSSGNSLGLPGAFTQSVPAATAALATGLAALYILWIRSRAGVYFGRFIGSIPATDKSLVVLTALCLIVIVGLVVAAFTSYPTTRHIYEGAMCALFAVYAFAAITGLIRRARG